MHARNRLTIRLHRHLLRDSGLTGTDYDILAVYPQQRYVPAKVRYFIDYLKEVYAQPDYWTLHE